MHHICATCGIPLDSQPFDESGAAVIKLEQLQVRCDQGERGQEPFHRRHYTPARMSPIGDIISASCLAA